MKKLIIIEDNWGMACMIEDVAGMLEIEVIGVAASWNESVELIAAQKPDFAIVDININGAVDGIEAARRLKKQNIDFLFLTAYKDLGTIEEATELSPLAYIVKPVTPENLMATFLLAMKKIERQTPAAKSLNYTIKNGDLLYNGSAMVNLSKSERKILELLIANIGHTVGYESLFYGVDNNIDVTNEASLRNIIAKLRKKCPDLTIKNIKDLGYIAF